MVNCILTPMTARIRFLFYGGQISHNIAAGIFLVQRREIGDRENMSAAVKCLIVWLFFLSISQVVCVCIYSDLFDINPLNIWQERLNYRSLNKMDVTDEAINGVIHDYGQSSLRVWNMFQKVLKGESIKMIVIGGSNSAGGGIPDHRQLYQQLFLR